MTFLVLVFWRTWTVEMPQGQFGWIWHYIGLYESLVLGWYPVFTNLPSKRNRLYSLQRRRSGADLIVTYKIFTGLLDVVLLMPFYSRHSTRFLKAPFIVLQDEIGCQNSRLAFLVRVAKYICLSFSTNIGYTLIFQAATQNLTFIPPITIKHLHVSIFPALSLWPLTARCGLILTIIKH